jgi:hypothetical protein
VHQHLEQVRRGEEEEGEAGEELDPPQRGIAVAHHAAVRGEGAVLAIVGGELAHRQEGVQHEQDYDHGDYAGHDDGEGLPEEEIPLEHLGDRPHEVLAHQDG